MRRTTFDRHFWSGGNRFACIYIFGPGRLVFFFGGGGGTKFVHVVIDRAHNLIALYCSNQYRFALE